MQNYQNHTIYIPKFIHMRVSFLPELWQCCTKWAHLCLFHFLVHTQATHILYFQLTGESGRTERKKNNGLPCSWFSFILGISDWPVDGSCMTKNGCNRVSRSFTFLRRSLSSKVETSSGSNGKHDLSQLSIFLLAQRCVEPNGVSCSRGTVNTLCKEGSGNKSHPCHRMLSAHTRPPGLHSQNTASKTKWWRKSRWQQQII